MNQMSCVWDASASWGEQRLLDGTLLLHDRGPPGPRAEPRWSPDEPNQGPEVPRSWLSRGRYETRPWPVCLSPFRFLPHKYQVIIIMAPALWSIERVPGADVKWGAPPSAFRGWWVSPLS